MKTNIWDYSIIDEKLAFINGYLKSIEILNSIADHGGTHWIIMLTSIDDDITNTIRKGINAPNWDFKATEISNWREVVKMQCTDFFFFILSELYGHDYIRDEHRKKKFIETYHLTNQLE